MEQDEIAEKLEEVWDAASACAVNDQQGAISASLREKVAIALRNLIDAPDTNVWVTKTNASGYRNQVWQGEGKSQPNDVIVLVDTSGNVEGVSKEARFRLSPLSKSGFDAVIVCEKTEGEDWEPIAVVEYEHSSVGEKLRQSFSSDLAVRRVSDPAIKTDTVGAASSPTSPEPLTLPPQILRHLREAKNVVLTGPPGTGKTHVGLLVADLLCDGVDRNTCRLEAVLKGRDPDEVSLDEIQAPSLIWDFVQLHPSYGYDEFVRGLRTNSGEKGFAMTSVDGALVAMARIAARRGDKPTLLIVDEINRANVAAVFGETIFAIDPGQRGRAVRLQYEGSGNSPDSLSIPPSMFILATMNTADRSIAMVDFALRRRFRFVHVPPSEQALVDYYSADDVRGKIAVYILKLLSKLVIDDDLKIGHSYLMVQPEAPRSEWVSELAARLHFEVKPLLREYAEDGFLANADQAAISQAELDFLDDSVEVLRAKLQALVDDEASDE